MHDHTRYLMPCGVQHQHRTLEAHTGSCSSKAFQGFGTHPEVQVGVNERVGVQRRAEEERARQEGVETDLGRPEDVDEGIPACPPSAANLKSLDAFQSFLSQQRTVT